ncbi:PilZ domain-containing protein [Curvibacter sp. HBC61]|uniref:PilZ domain-containing protein n=1 Tax=Curvibacter cyanobacteriorum TaxID=3026422 RepID=A0ABT5N533_9BURK|nr:PilZ domain-containing protein [Curvibacter sp. HBC61]MDD0840202.1 PilZ domain-containing protein [Curvibacter sp. HBC61]
MSALLPISPSVDRRIQSRKLIRVPAVLDIAGRAPLSVRTVELSASGLGLSCPVNLAPGLMCTVSFRLLGPASLTELVLPGQLTYSVLSQRDGGFRIGVQFKNLSTDNAKRLEACLTI